MFPRISPSLLRACLIPLLIAATAANAQTNVQDILLIPVEESGQAYTDTTARRGIETELIYLHPDADESLPREANAKKPAGNNGLDVSRYLTIAILVAVLIAIAVFAYRLAPNATISMSSPKEIRRRGSIRPGIQNGETEAASDKLSGLDFIERLQAMTDRRAAIILLLKRCLQLALDANGLALGRSQTAREILYRLPRTWLHIDALSHIVRIEERVQFGGEDLPEPVFQESIELARPMFNAGPVAQ